MRRITGACCQFQRYVPRKGTYQGAPHNNLATYFEVIRGISSSHNRPQRPGHLFLAGPPVSGQAIQSAWKCSHSSVKRPPISRDISRAIQLHFATRYRILQGTCKIASWTDYSPGSRPPRSRPATYGAPVVTDLCFLRLEAFRNALFSVYIERPTGPPDSSLFPHAIPLLFPSQPSFLTAPVPSRPASTRPAALPAPFHLVPRAPLL